MFCSDDYSLIENYELAINDAAQTWHCHHKKETDEGLSTKQLIELGIYYGRPANELIFLTPSEHKHLHHPFYGKHHTEESKQRMSESHKGKGIGAKRSDETKQKISEALKGKNIGKIPWNKGIPQSEETKQKLRDAITGKHRVYHADGTYHYEK